MAAKNDITGDSIQTRGTSQAYLDNYDLIFGKKKKKVDNSGTDKNEYYDVLSTEECIDGEEKTE